MLYYSMTHRTQLYLDETQYRWLRQQAGRNGSIAAVVRGLIDEARTANADADASGDPFIQYLGAEPAGRGKKASSVETLDRDLYG